MDTRWLKNLIAKIRQRPRKRCKACLQPWRTIGATIPWFTPGHEEAPQRWQMYRCGCGYRMVQLDV